MIVSGRETLAGTLGIRTGSPPFTFAGAGTLVGCFSGSKGGTSTAVAISSDRAPGSAAPSCGKGITRQSRLREGNCPVSVRPPSSNSWATAVTSLRATELRLSAYEEISACSQMRLITRGFPFEYLKIS